MTGASPTFVLGLGAQKAGTTWLHDYLGESEQFATGFRKEYHVLDALDPPLEPHRRRYMLDMAAREVHRLEQGRSTRGGHLHAAAMLADPGRYFDYFTGLLGQPGIRATGDMTPAYALLGPDRLRVARDGFAARGVRVLPVFLMRDPVDRVWSAARMYVQGVGAKKAEAEVTGDPLKRLRAHYDKESYELRTRYDRTLAALDEVFAPGECYVGFFETLFTRESTAALCAMTGLAHHDPPVERRSNATRRNHEEQLPEETERMVAEHYAPVYAAVAARFPVTDLRSLWPSARWVL